jgi:AcrR family transcriptional regulator
MSDSMAAKTGSRPSAWRLDKRARTTQRNRAAIVAAARESFCDVGYGASTVRDIMRRTDLASGTFYNYYTDKASVLRDLIDEFSARIRHRVHTTRMEARSLEELLRSAFRACFEQYAEDRFMTTLLARNAGEVRELTSTSVLEPAIAELADDLRAKAAEIALPDVDVDRVSRAAVALATELGFDMIQQRPIDVDGTTEFVTQLMLGGVQRLASARLTRNGRRGGH